MAQMCHMTTTRSATVQWLERIAKFISIHPMRILHTEEYGCLASLRTHLFAANAETNTPLS